MRIASGVLLILVSLLHGCAGAGITFLGAASDEIAKSAEESADRSEMSEAERAKMREGMSKVSDASGMLILLGVGLLVLFGLELAAAVCLFSSKAAKFIIAVGVLGIGLSIAQIIFGDGKGAAAMIFPVICIAISALAIMSARGMQAESRPGKAAPPPTA